MTYSVIQCSVVSVTESVRTTAMNDELVTLKWLTCYTKLGKTCIYERIRRGDLPTPMKFGRASRWRRSEIEAAVERLR